jgi:GAF domain-containing protein
MSLTTDLTADLTVACASLRGLLGAAACSCALADEDGAELEFAAASGAGADAIVGVRLPVSRGIAGFVAMSGQPIVVGDVATDQRFARDVAEATDYVPTTIMGAPLLDEDGETLGVLSVLDPRQGSVADLALLTAFAAQVAVVVRLARRVDRLSGAAADARLAQEVLAAVARHQRERG